MSHIHDELLQQIRLHALAKVEITTKKLFANHRNGLWEYFTVDLML